MAVALGLMPHNVAPSLPYDKLQHVVGFMALTICGLLWVTKKSPFVVALALAGGALELVQGLPMIGRKAALLDWFASVLGIAVGLASMARQSARWTPASTDHSAAGSQTRPLTS